MRLNFLLLVSIACTCLLSCKKSNSSENEMLYGEWKTSYGDTIRFYRSGNKDLLAYDNSLNSAMPIQTIVQYRFQQQKLAKLNPSAGWTTLNTFNWVDRGNSFTVQGVEWFMFLSSTQTVFTFTRIR